MSNFFEDLVRIRKEKRLSRQDVFYKCRIPIETIETIEDGSIFSGKMRNKTYVRSYFRTYGKAIGISDEDMTTALDEHESGLYDSSLISKYIAGRDTADSAETDEASESGEDTSPRHKIVDPASEQHPEKDTIDPTSEPNPEKDNANSASEQHPEKDNVDPASKPTPEKDTKKSKPGKIITPESQEKTLQDVDWEDQNFSKIQSTSTTGFGSSESRGYSPPSTVKLPEPPDVKTIDWSTKVKKAVYRPQKNRLFWVIIAIVLASGIALASIVWYWKSEDRADPLRTAPEQTTDAARPGSDSISSPRGDDQSLASGDTRATAGAGGGINQNDLAAGERIISNQNTPPAEAPDPAGRITLPEGASASQDPISSMEPTPADNTTPAGEPPPAPERTELTEQDIINELAVSASTGDTLYVFAYALYGNLEPVRVLSDIFTADRTIGTIPRPYWVEQSQMMRFDFLDEIIFQGNLSRMAIIFNGHLIQDYDAFFLDGSRIRISRESLIENGFFEFSDANPFTEIDTPRSIVYRPRF